MWEIEYKDEAKFYFLDNHPYTFDLLVKIEELRYQPDAMPPEGVVEISPKLYFWLVAEHLVCYGVQGQTITVVAIKPIE